MNTLNGKARLWGGGVRYGRGRADGVIAGQAGWTVQPNLRKEEVKYLRVEPTYVWVNVDLWQTCTVESNTDWWVN